MANKTTCQRISRYLLIIILLISAIISSLIPIKRYQNNPIVISIERDHFNWSTNFPAVTICPEFQLNVKMLENYQKQKNMTAFRLFVEKLSKANYYNFENIPNYDSDSQLYQKLIDDFNTEFRPVISSNTDIGLNVELVKILTEMGVCYVFNSPLNTENILNINAYDTELSINIANISTGFNIYFHGPYEVVDITSKKITSPNGNFLQVYLSALTLFSSEHVKNSLAINQRKCRFYDESNLKHFPVYSYVMCRMDCRANLALKFCGCVPHFYRKLDNEIVCNVTGLHCLARHKEKLIWLKNQCKDCLPNCDEVNYVLVDMDTREWFLGSNLQWGLKDYPKMRLRRDVIFGFSNLLVYIGGVAGFFLGCSVLSIVEIIYFMTIRLYWYSVKYMS